MSAKKIAERASAQLSWSEKTQVIPKEQRASANDQKQLSACATVSRVFPACPDDLSPRSPSATAPFAGPDAANTPARPVTLGTLRLYFRCNMKFALLYHSGGDSSMPEQELTEIHPSFTI